MTPREFFDSVVKPNADELFAPSRSVRSAVNAILTLDAFFGILFAELKSMSDPAVVGLAPGDDSKYREQLANQSPKFKVLRDTADALKHGELTRRPRIVAKAKQVKGTQAGAGTLMAGADSLGGTIVYIEQIQPPGPPTYERADYVASNVLKIAEAKLACHGL